MTPEGFKGRLDVTDPASAEGGVHGAEWLDDFMTSLTGLITKSLEH